MAEQGFETPTLERHLHVKLLGLTFTFSGAGQSVNTRFHKVSSHLEHVLRFVSQKSFRRET